MKTALVTGHLGFIGRHMKRRLLQDGWEVSCCDNKTGPSGDCRKIFAGDHKFDIVIHAAACVGGRVGIDNTPMWVAQDIGIDNDFFQYVMRTKPRRAIYFSSSAAYPLKYQKMDDVMLLQESDIDLDNISTPDAIYGWTKLVGEKQAEILRQYGRSIQVLRPFSGYGSDQDRDYPFPAFIYRAANKISPFPIWGGGRQVRDWIHIDDIIEKVMACVELDEVVGPMNLCSGIGTSMDQIVGLIIDRFNLIAQIEHHPEAPTGVAYRVGDPGLMIKTVGAPRISLVEGIDRAYQYMHRIGD